MKVKQSQMSGTELVKQVRANNPNIPVMYMSGFADGSLGKGEIAPAKFIEFLQKPVAHDVLGQRVRAILDRRNSVPPPPPTDSPPAP